MVSKPKKKQRIEEDRLNDIRVVPYDSIECYQKIG